MRGRDEMRINIFMKSGSVIALSRVRKWEIGFTRNQVTSLSIEYYRWSAKERLIVGSIDLSNIEAMTKTD